ncbi:MAG TPA: VOC family protein [Salinivirgaceae bacterium]|nr:VOC family protein [Salinivirgaceae bacterium]
MNKYIISGIQQMGVGVANFHEAWNWYITHFGMDIRIFEERAVAELMLPHTGGEKRERHAALAFNMLGGGGFEIWQHTGKKPQPIDKPLSLGDLGINVTKMKCPDINKAYQYQQNVATKILGDVTSRPDGKKHFFVEDLYGNIFEFVETPEYFTKTKVPSGGVYGAIIGVRNIEESLVVYGEILGYQTLIYDIEQSFVDFTPLKGGGETFRRVLLTHPEPRKGAFAPILGSSEIELIEVKSRTPKDIFEGRMWGDPGFIHLCFDIQGMAAMRNTCQQKGFPFTVDSNNSFDMGEAAGHFSYIQAPEGTLIEFVETHKVPIMKKWNWFIDLTKRNPEKSLPRIILKALGLNRISKV